MDKSILMEKSMYFSMASISFYKTLILDNEYVLSRQFLKSSTSIGANIREARYAESKKDFIHKLYIAIKECNETLYWLELIRHVDKYDNQCISNLYNLCSEMLKMLSASIKTSKYNK